MQAGELEFLDDLLSEYTGSLATDFPENNIKNARKPYLNDTGESRLQPGS